MELTIKISEVRTLSGLKGYHFITHQRRKKKIIRLVKRHCNNGCSLLDVGCGCGDIALELAHHGYNVVGIDLEPLRIQKANSFAEKYGKGRLFSRKRFQDFEHVDKFDVILLGEVLEHFENPVDVLKQVEKILAPDGLVIITTPNMPSLRNRLQFGLLGIFPDNNPEHKYYFDHRRFKDTVVKAGYHMAYFDTCFTNLVMKGYLITQVENILLGWFTKLFKKSGDTLCAVLRKEESSK
jgi:2-polyprenyl-3-methyl-5-hydroxy-6-metoxy-1,4-benzoquinol methylase